MKTLEGVAEIIESIMAIDCANVEINLIAVVQFLKIEGLHLIHKDDFLDSLLQRKNFYTLEERLCQHVVEFMGDGDDRNEGLALKDVA